MINKWILYYIRKAKRNQIDDFLTNARKRKEELFPGWEIIYLALPKENRKKRIEYMERILDLERTAENV